MPTGRGRRITTIRRILVMRTEVCVIRGEEVILTLPISWFISSTDNLTKLGSTRKVNQVGGVALSEIVLETTRLVS